jgi:hypothetical protein
MYFSMKESTSKHCGKNLRIFQNIAAKFYL